MNTQHKKFLAITAVVFLHVAVITLMLAQHGCKSSGAKAGTPEPAKPATEATPAPMPAPVAVDNTFVTPTRPPPETPIAPIPAGQYSEPLTAEPTPAPAPSAPAVTWVVAKGDSLSSIAKKNGITVDQLVAANAPKVTKTSILKIGQSLTVPAQSSSASAVAAASTGSAEEGSLYTVQSGDTLSKIAQKNGTTIAALKSVNKLTSNVLRAGQKLKLPAGSSATTATAVASSSAASVDTSSGEYTVAAGDTLSRIAVKTGTKVSELMSANNLTDATARTLHPGQKLKLPEGANASAAAAPAMPTVVTPVPAPASLLPLTPATPSDVTAVPSATTTAPITPVQ